jgi:poly [ADP-ribose] polymerase
MPNLIEEIKLVFADVTDNHNKVWYGLLYDNDDCETRWGRVGYDLQSKMFPGTGKSFLDKKRKEKIAKGYTELKTVGSGSLSPTTGVTIKNSELHLVAKSQLVKSANPTLERLIKRFVDANVHKITSSTQITYNSTTGLFATPLGIVEQSGLDEARNLLAQMSPLIRSHNFGPSADTLISKYLRLIPQHLGMKRFSAQSLIPDDNALQKQLDLIDSLESSYQALQVNPTPKTDGKPQEQVFKVDLDVLTDSNERNRLNRFFETSKKRMHGYDNVRVKEIFKVNIHEMDNKFNAAMKPVMEVFHGTSIANALSILKSGLKVSPPDTAVIAGKMMGNGIYGAINSTKSLGYCSGRWTGQTNNSDSYFLFVCSFAMGTIYTTYTASTLPSGYDSVWAKAGQALRNDELVVYKNNQVNINYLLECK